MNKSQSQLQFCIHHPNCLLTHVCINNKECESISRLACDNCVLQSHSNHAGVIHLSKFAIMANAQFTKFQKEHFFQILNYSDTLERLEVLTQDAQLKKKIENKIKALQEKLIQVLQNQKEKLNDMVAKQPFYGLPFKNMIAKLMDQKGRYLFTEDYVKFLMEMIVEGAEGKLQYWEEQKEALRMKLLDELEKIEGSAEKLIQLNQNPKLQNKRGSMRSSLGIEQKDQLSLSFITEERQKMDKLQQLLPYNAGSFVCDFRKLQCQDLIVSCLENSLKVFNMKTLKCTQEIKGGEEYYDIVEVDSNTIAVGQWQEQQVVIYRRMVYGEWSQVMQVAMQKGSPSMGVFSEKLNAMIWSNGYWGIDGNCCMVINCFDEYSTKAFYTKYDVKALCLMRNQELFLCGDKAGNIYIWNISNNQAPLLVVETHTNYVRGLRQLRNGCVVSCSDDKTIKVWNQDIHEEPLYVAQLPSEPYILELCDAHIENLDELIVTAHSDGCKNTLRY